MKRERFECNDGGTLFCEEIEELNAKAQIKNILQE